MPSVTVVGSINLDLVAECTHLPRPGETITAQRFATYPGGKGANQALAAHRAGAEVRMMGAVGDDPQAEQALALLRTEGLDLSGLEVVDGPTGLALITVDQAGENHIVVVPGANAALDPAAVDTSGADVVLCQLEIPMATVEAAAVTAEGMFCLNAAPAATPSRPILDRADVIIVNETEKAALASALEGSSALLVTTLGRAGARAERAGKVEAIAVPPDVEAVDTVGAGDAFTGVLVTALGDGSSIDIALNRACVAGALATTRPGAQTSLPTAEEIERRVGT